MKSAVVLLPGLNRDRDMIAALTKISGKPPLTVWQTDTEIPDVDLIVIPGGFSYGDYLRCGAIAARMPALRAVKEKADRGVMVMGVCNGFQILLEAGMLPGALMRNASLRFVCREVKLQVANANTAFTRGYAPGQIIRCPVAHHDGNYFADAETLKRLEGEGQVVFRYADGTNPNGSINDIAGIVGASGNVLGLMPHPENLIEAAHGGSDGRPLFESVLGMAAGRPARPCSPSASRARWPAASRLRPRRRPAARAPRCATWSRWPSPRIVAGSPAAIRPSRNTASPTSSTPSPASRASCWCRRAISAAAPCWSCRRKVPPAGSPPSAR